MIPFASSDRARELSGDRGKVANRSSCAGSDLVCAVIVTYRPDMDRLRDNLGRVVQQVGNVVVFDNDSDATVRSAVKDLVASVAATRPVATVVLLSEGTNLGLPKAYNRSMRTAKELGAEFILLLDQDSLVEPQAVERLVTTFRGISGTRPVGAVCCTTVELVRLSRPLNLMKELLRTGIYRRTFEAMGDLGFPGVREIPSFTNAGTMLPLCRVDEVGGFDESLFLDAVDHEFSLRLRDRGFGLFLVEGARMLHPQGETLRTSIAGIGLELRKYASERYYLIVRDTLRFARRWGRRFPRVVGVIVLSMVFNSLAAFLFLSQKSSRARLAIQALTDFGQRSSILPVTDPP